MNKLHVLPNGDGLDLRRVTAVKFVRAITVREHNQEPAVRVEYECYDFGQNQIAAIEVPFRSDTAALTFRDELIKLVNNAGKPTWKADQLEAAPDGSGFGDWYQRYRVWNRDKTVVLLHTDVLKDAIEFLNKQE